MHVFFTMQEGKYKEKSETSAPIYPSENHQSISLVVLGVHWDANPLKRKKDTGYLYNIHTTEQKTWM